MKMEILPDLPAKAVEAMDTCFLQPDGRMKLFDSSIYRLLPPNILRVWCHHRARYGVPTTELVEWLKTRIGKQSALEICAGAGDLGHYVGIPMTDSYIQTDDPQRAEVYRLMGQPATKPHADVIKEDAQTAVIRRRPDVVVGSWVMQLWLPGDKHGQFQGPREEVILANCKEYILIGTDSSHGDKRIMSRPHEKLRFPWLVSRAADQTQNAIWIFKGEK